MKFASKSTRGFYTPDIHGENIPADVVEISDEHHAELIEGQSKGKIIDWSGSVPTLVDPPRMTAIELCAQRLAAINAGAAAMLSQLSASYPDGEVQSWGQQTREAEALAIDPNAAAPLLTAISASRGVPLSMLAERVRAKVQAYAIASGRIIGQRQALEDALMAVDLQAADAAAQLDAIVWPTA